jgi:hypothetical protein
MRKLFESGISKEEYHKKYIFRAEYLGLLELFKTPYEERYIFEDLK